MITGLKPVGNLETKYEQSDLVSEITNFVELSSKELKQLKEKYNLKIDLTELQKSKEYLNRRMTSYWKPNFIY